MKKKEFGYVVSRNYKKLWEYLKTCGSGKCVFGFYDDEKEREFVIFYSPIKTGDPITAVFFQDAIHLEEDFVEWCNAYNVIFIDPKPIDQNTIYYTDGSRVETKDNIKNTDGESAFEGKIGKKIIRSFILIERGCYYVLHKFQDGQIFRIIANDCFGIKWDGNRMINVVKVEE